MKNSNKSGVAFFVIFVLCCAVAIGYFSYGVSGGVTCTVGNSIKKSFTTVECESKYDACGTWTCYSPTEFTMKFCTSASEHTELCALLNKETPGCNNKKCTTASGTFSSVGHAGALGLLLAIVHVSLGLAGFHAFT